MIPESSLLSRARQLRDENNWGNKRIAAALGISRQQAERLLNKLKLEDAAATPQSATNAIPVALVRESPNGRPLIESHVAALVESIGQIDLIEPIVVRRHGDAFEIIAGAHRTAAFRRLERESIPAIIIDVSDLTAELMLIDENLIRQDLSPAERSIALRRRKIIYEELHPELKHGGDRKSELAKSSRQIGNLIDETTPENVSRETAAPEQPRPERFSAGTAKATGISERAIQRAVTRATALGDTALKQIIGTSLDKGEELDALAKISEPKRDELIARAMAGETVTAKPAVKQEIRAAREADLGEKIAAGNLALPTKRYGVILADPEWKFETWSANGMDRAADNHYATSETEKIAARPIADIAAKDCVLFLWATAPMLTHALHVMAAWGFTYKSHGIWDKEIAGTGYWFRNQHEVLLVGTRGDIPAPAMGTQPSSVFREARGEHSVKPMAFHELIERWFPSVPKIELNARAVRPGWDAWGAEAPAAEAAE